MKRSFTALVVSFAFFSFINSCSSEKEGITIGFTGDILLDRGVRKQIEREGYESFYTDIGKDIPELDFLVANLEGPVTSIKNPIHKKYIFRGEPDNTPWLKKIGITHMNLANNHSYDQGRKGLRDMIDLLEQYDLEVLGYGENPEKACQPVLLEKNNQKILFFSTVFLQLENWMPLQDSCNICQWDHLAMGEAIQNSKKEHPEAVIIVSCHWGLEHITEPSPDQVRQAHHLINKGADAVVGHHPHVLQKTEVYKGKPIFYSLGNFIFDQEKEINSQSKLVEISIKKGEISWKEHSYYIEDCKPKLVDSN